MKKANFIKHLVRQRDTYLLDDDVIYEYDYKDLIGLKKLSGCMDFGCRFDENGKCNGNKEWIGEHPACCCKDCFQFG